MTDDLSTGRRVLSIEAEALNEMAASLDENFIRAVEACNGVTGRVICAGIGKSGHVARKIAATLASTGTPAQFVHPNEASHGDLGMINKGDVVLALSRSGETAELNDLIHYTRRFSIPLISITAVAGSTLGKAGDIPLLIPDAKEACAQTNAPTTSTTLMMAMGDALAVALLERRGFKADDFRVFHPGGKLGAMLKTIGDVMHTESELPIVQSGASLQDALAQISEKGFGCVGVVNTHGALIGMMTDGDTRRLLASGQRVETVDGAMTANPMTTTPDALAASVLSQLNDKKITQIFVLNDGAPVGLVHVHDLLRAGVS